MNRSVKLLVGLAALAVVAVAAVLLIGRASSDAIGTTAPVTTSRSAEPSGKQAHQVAEALGRLTTDPDSLVATGSREQVGQSAREGVPAGSTLDVDEASWAPDGVGGGAIAATLHSPGQPPVTYAVVMVSESGKWKVTATVPSLSRPDEDTALCNDSGAPVDRGRRAERRGCPADIQCAGVKLAPALGADPDVNPDGSPVTRIGRQSPCPSPPPPQSTSVASGCFSSSSSSVAVVARSR